MTFPRTARAAKRHSGQLELGVPGLLARCFPVAASRPAQITTSAVVNLGRNLGKTFLSALRYNAMMKDTRARTFRRLAIVSP
jgi:hypothetical protein